MNAYYQWFISLLMLFTFHTDFCLDKTVGYVFKDPNRSLTLTESIVLGGAVGAAEVAFPGQILSYAMNMAINQKPFIVRNAYQGVGANAMGQMPIAAVQKAVQVKGSELIESVQGYSLSQPQKFAISFVAGVGGSMIDTPSNAVQLYLQNPKNATKNMWQACRDLGRKSFRGSCPNAIKEGLFTIGYQALAPQGKQVVGEYVDNNTVATALGGSLAGALTALMTQPGAVIRNKMQGDLKGDVYSTVRKTVQKIYHTAGVRGFFIGLKQRGARVMVAVPLYVAYTNMLERQMKR